MIIPASQLGVSYVVYTDGVKYYVRKGGSGLPRYVSDDAGDVINYAISNLPDSGGRIFIKSGTYSVKTPIVINKTAVMIEGEQLGYGSVPGAQLVLDGDFHMITITGGAYFAYIRNLWMDGNNRNYSAIYINNANDVTIEHNFIYRFNNAFIHNVNFMHILRIIDNWIESGGGQGIWLGGTSTVETVFINNNYFFGVKNAVVIPTYPSDVFSVVISNNIIRQTTLDAILVSKGALVVIEGNAILDAGSASPNTYDGIKLENVSGVVVSGNEIINYKTGNMKYAVEEVGTADYNLISNNVVKSASTPAIVKVGANTVVANNIQLP